MRDKSIRVLVCDDDKACRLTLIDALCLDGFETYEAGGGYEAMDLARSISLDFGFFDYKLPDLDGATTVRLIRRESIVFPFVIMSGEKMLNKTFGSDMGAVAFMPKPLELCEIRRILHKYFSL